MKPLLNKLRKSKYSQRILKLGLAYVLLELVIAIGAILFVAQEALN